MMVADTQVNLRLTTVNIFAILCCITPFVGVRFQYLTNQIFTP